MSFNFAFCVNQLSITVTKHLKQIIKRKSLLWIRDLVVSVHDSLLWACGDTVHHGRSVWWRRLLASWLVSKGNEEEGLGFNIPFKIRPP
jgi:hypothetical protein